MITHNLSLDMLNPDVTARIPVKQGDTLSHIVDILLFADSQPWTVPTDAVPLIRWFACDPETGESARGIYDCLPDGTHAWQYTENLLTIVPCPQMFALPGIVKTDILFTVESRTLATFNFEFYVNRAPADGTEPEAQDYYQVTTLEQLNTTLTHLQTLITELREDMEEELALVEQRLTRLEQTP